MSKEFSIDYSKVHPGILQLRIAEDKAKRCGAFAAGFYAPEFGKEQVGDTRIVNIDKASHFFLGSRNGTYDEDVIRKEIDKYVERVSGQVVLGEKRPPQISYHHEKTLGTFMREPHQKLTQPQTVMFHVIAGVAPDGFYSLPRSERNRIIRDLEEKVEAKLREKHAKNNKNNGS